MLLLPPRPKIKTFIVLAALQKFRLKLVVIVGFVGWIITYDSLPSDLGCSLPFGLSEVIRPTILLLEYLFDFGVLYISILEHGLT